MKKLIKQRLQSADSGIAIMFSLMMMAVFLVLGMGFSAYMTNIRRGAEFHKDIYLSDSIDQVIQSQISAAITGFLYPISDLDREYFNSIPEACPDIFANANFTQPAATTNETHPFKLWGTDDTDASITNTLINFDWGNLSDGTTEETIWDGSFSGPNGNSLGWQENKINSNNANDLNYAISNWFVLGLSGRLDPLAYGKSGTADDRAEATDISKLNLANIISDTTHLDNILQINVLPDPWDTLMEIQAGTQTETGYYSFFPIESLSTDTTDYNETTDGSTIPTTTDKTSFLADAAYNTFNLYNMGLIDNATTMNQVRDGIYYLGGNYSSESATTQTQIDQISANIKDYCDNDNEAETDNEDAPTYVGNEPVPYINELEVIVTVEFDEDSSNTANYNACQPTVEFTAEFIQMYKNSLSLTPQSLEFEISINYNAPGSVSAPTETLTVSCPIADILSSGTSFPTSTRAYSQSNLFSVSGAKFSFPSTAKTSCSLSAVQITLTKVIKLKGDDGTGTVLWDIADLRGKLSSIGIPSLTNANEAAITIECGEPKLNHISSNWTANTWDLALVSSPATLTVVNRSTVFSRPASGIDKEPFALTSGNFDPIKQSTNYIRNDVMRSLHELGYIHRGVAHQTLNLIEFNTGSEDSYFSGDIPVLPTIGNYTNSGTDALYTTNSAPNNSSEDTASSENVTWSNSAQLSDGGDRSILNFISLDGAEESVSTRGLINPNTPHYQVLKLLFSDIEAFHPGSSGASNYVGDTSSASDNTISALSEPQIQTLISNFPGTDGTNDFPTATPTEGYFDAYWFKNRMNNPPSYGVPFKKALTTDTFSDRQLEVLLCNTRRFVSTNRNTYIGIIRTRVKEGMDTSIPSHVADPDGSGSTESHSMVYIFRELIDIYNTPHNPSDDLYRVRSFNQTAAP
jgi:hypothetical protein